MINLHRSAPALGADYSSMRSPVRDDLEVPFVPTHPPTADLGRALGLGPAPSPGHRDCRNAFLLALVHATEAGYAGIHYSRRKTSYGSTSYRGFDFLTYRHVRWAMDSLEAAPQFFHSIRTRGGRPSPGAPSQRSRLWAGPEFDRVVSAVEAFPIGNEGQDLVILRDRNGRQQQFVETDETARTRQFLQVYNRRLSQSSIILDPEIADEVGLSSRPRTSLRRIYNRSLGQGGRLFGGFWMTLSKEARAWILIDGEPVVERDHRALHPRLLLAAAGVDDLDRDPYDIRGLRRDDVKKTVVVLINAPSPETAIRAVDRYLEGRHDARDVLQAVENHLPELARFWCTCVGLDLMNIEANAALAVLQDLDAKGIAALPVHDSFVIARRHEALLDDMMRRSFEAACAEARARLGSGAVRFCERGPTLVPSVSCPPSPHPGHADRMRERARALLADIEAVIHHEKRITVGRARVAAVCFANLGNSPFLLRRLCDWLTGLGEPVGLAFVQSRVDRIVADVRSRAEPRVSDLGASKLTRATEATSATLKLAIIVSVSGRVRPAARHQANRLARGVRPRVVDLDVVKPWLDEGLSRAVWYRRHPDALERQRLAIESLARCGHHFYLNEALNRLRDWMSLRRRRETAAKLVVPLLGGAVAEVIENCDLEFHPQVVALLKAATTLTNRKRHSTRSSRGGSQ